MKGLPKRSTSTLNQKLLSFLTTFVGLIVLSAVVYYGLGWMKGAFGAATPWIAAVLVFMAYVGLVKYSTLFPALGTDIEITQLPETGPTVKAGLYYLLPVVLLVWCLIVERLSPGLSALYASVFMLVILLTQRPLKAMLHKSGEDIGQCLRQGLDDVCDVYLSVLP